MEQRFAQCALKSETAFFQHAARTDIVRENHRLNAVYRLGVEKIWV